MIRYFYSLLIASRLNNNDLFQCLNLVKKYGLLKKAGDDDAFVGVDGSDGLYTVPINEETGKAGPLFVRVTNEPETVCAFFENLMFKFFQDTNTGDKIIRIFMKSPEDSWLFYKVTDGGPIDVLNPVNVHAEVYIDYDVSVLELDRCFGQNYKSGSWNKMFYRSLNSFIDFAQGLTEINKIKKAYERR